MKRTVLCLAVVSMYLVVGSWSCAPFYNVRISRPAFLSAPYVQQDDQTLIFVALSGGGTRAAAMSWKALEILKDIAYVYTDENGIEVTSTLADEIDYISGISGGSFAAAAWCLYRNNMETFRKRFIERNIQWELFKGLFIPPWQGMRLLSPQYDRINMAAELYDNTVFEKKTFADLPPHPVVWIHATSLALGNRFTFTQTYFDLIGSDLSSYPIGYACAASSAFPILLSPINLINYGDSISLEDEVKYKMAKENSRQNIEKDFYCKMREFYNDKSNKYIHLADGGLVDNQGLQAIIDQFDTNGIINKKLNDRDNPLRRLIIINVNAGVSPDDTSSKSPNAPNVSSVIKYTMVTSMDILSAKRWMIIKERCRDIYKGVLSLGDSTPSLTLLEKPYTIEISFRNIEDKSLRAECYKLPTSFHLLQEQLKLIDKVVPILIDQDNDMKRLRTALSP